jgi:hypothetical protein
MVVIARNPNAQTRSNPTRHIKSKGRNRRKVHCEPSPETSDCEELVLPTQHRWASGDIKSMIRNRFGMKHTGEAEDYERRQHPNFETDDHTAKILPPDAMMVALMIAQKSTSSNK